MAFESPQQPAADRQQQRKDHDLGAADALGAALAVIPRQHQRDDKADDQHQRDAALQSVRPAELMRNYIHALQQRERERDIRGRPLHQLALLQAGKESSGGFSHGIALR
ncbi:MAG TPA: hypothetical protein VFK31_03160 [Rhodanobacteraceae bacterium]|nr:hypothetical protein [Rhodanobacteraceae bacterium]